MKKIFLIIQREYLSRVRKKSFVITTLLFPLLYVALIFGMGFLAEKGATKLNIAVIDSSGKFTAEKIERANQQDASNTLQLVHQDLVNLEKDLASTEEFDGFVVIPAHTAVSKAPDQLIVKSRRTLGNISGVQSKLNNIWNDIKYEDLGIDNEKRQLLSSSRLMVKAENIENKASDGTIASVIGYVAGFLIYFILIIYGSQVMMGVMEEKTNRIAEVMVSSVKPFQLMLGKIIGIALVALTQFLLWVAFIFLIYNITKTGSTGKTEISQVVGGIQQVFSSVDVALVLVMFAFYFLGGFFFYSSLYAAIGSAVNEDMREAQSLSFPVTMIIIIAIVILTVAMQDPTGPLAVWGSIIPFTSPIVMLARIPFGVPGTVPYWQLLLSMGLLVAGFLFMVWFAGKIYRTGILMYGKKPTWKEMLRWAFRKQ